MREIEKESSAPRSTFGALVLAAGQVLDLVVASEGAEKKCLVLQKVMIPHPRPINLELEHGRVLEQGWMYSHRKSGEEVG